MKLKKKGQIKTALNSFFIWTFSLASISYYLNKEDFMQSHIGTKYFKISWRKTCLTFFHSCLAFSSEGRQPVSHSFFTRTNTASFSSRTKVILNHWDLSWFRVHCKVQESSWGNFSILVHLRSSNVVVMMCSIHGSLSLWNLRVYPSGQVVSSMLIPPDPRGWDLFFSVSSAGSSGLSRQSLDGFHERS